MLTFKASQILKQALNAKRKRRTATNGGGTAHVNGNGDGAALGRAASGFSTGSAGGGMNVPLAASASEAPKE